MHMKGTVFWNVMPYSQVELYKISEELQSRSVG
jgi:hypothetical protein